MKKVVFKAVEVVISIENVENRDNVGILWRDKTKGVVVEVERGYCIMNNDCNNTIGSVYNPSKKDYLKDRVKNGDVKEVFVFNSYKELLQWFSS